MTGSAAPPDIRLARAYDLPNNVPGARVLVDRLWPRGITRADLRLDLWAREAAPGNDLRRWFGHRPDRWAEFSTRYRAELRDRPDALAGLLALCRRGPVTLIFGAKDRLHNQAVVLREILLEELAGTPGH